MGTVDPLTRVQFPVPAPLVRDATWPNFTPQLGHSESFSLTGFPQLGHSYVTVSPGSSPGCSWNSGSEMADSSPSVPSSPVSEVWDTTSAKWLNSVPHSSHLCCTGETSAPQNGHSNLTFSNDAPHRGQHFSVPATVFPHERHPKMKTGSRSLPMQ